MKKKPKTSPLTLFIYFALALMTLTVFLQIRNFDFVNYDDYAYVRDNQHVLSGLTADNVIWAFTTGYNANWHPVTWLSLMLDCQLFGPDPGRIHLVNVFLHLANALLLFAILKKITGSLWPSAFVAAVFAVHPMHVESVAWIAERKDVLSTLFLLMTVAAYAGYVKCPSVYRYCATLTMFALGLMAKPMLVTLPFVLLLLDYWPLNRFELFPPSDRRKMLYRCAIEKIPFFALAVVSSVVTFMVQRAGGAMADTNVVFWGKRFVNAIISYTQYIGKMFWPENLAVFYPLDAAGIPLWQIVLSGLLLAGMTFLVLYAGRTRKYLPVGWFWFLGTLVPVIGLVQVGSQAYADRYTYIPYVGLFIMIAWGLPELLSKWRYHRPALSISMIIVLIAMGTAAHRQVSVWKDSLTLFSHALEVTQNNCLVNNNLGTAYADLGRYPEAIEALKQAIRIEPNDPEANNNLGAAYYVLGRYQEAIKAYETAIRSKPDYANAYSNLGTVYGDLGRYPEAIEAYLQAIKLNPDDAKAQSNLGAVYYSLGHYPEAIEAFKQAIRIKPDYAKAHFCLGLAYLEAGDNARALEEYKILKTLDAEMAGNLFNLINQ